MCGAVVLAHGLPYHFIGLILVSLRAGLVHVIRHFHFVVLEKFVRQSILTAGFAPAIKLVVPLNLGICLL